MKGKSIFTTFDIIMIRLKEHIPFYIILSGVIIVFFFTLEFPFFGDMTYISSVAHDIYDSNFSKIINPNNDNGTPPLFSLYFAGLWKLFGRNLVVSHFGILVFFIGLLYQFYKLSLRFIPKKLSIIAVIVLLSDPIFSTQFSIMTYDIVLVFFFLLGINSVFDKRYLLLILSTIIIALLNLRGFTIVISLFAIHCYLNKQYSISKIIKTSILYIPALMGILLWINYHHQVMGWYAVSPSNSNLHNIGGFSWVVKNLAFEIIAFFSNGRFILLFIVLSIISYLIFKKKSIISSSIKELSIFFLLTISPFILIFTTTSYPTGPRYFMIAYPLFYLIFIYFVNEFEKNIKFKSSSTLIYGIAIFSFIQSIFWFNPYPYTNAWDSNLKLIHFFNIQKQMLDKVKDGSINPAKTYTSFPLHKNFKYAYVNDKYDIQFQEYAGAQLKKGDMVIHANIYSDLELAKPKSGSAPMFHFQKGGAWMDVYIIK